MNIDNIYIYIHVPDNHLNSRLRRITCGTTWRFPTGLGTTSTPRPTAPQGPDRKIHRKIMRKQIKMKNENVYRFKGEKF